MPEDLGVPIEYLDPSVFQMTEVEIDGYGYIGYLTIPSLNLELPIMADWDYTRLRIAPCWYYGSVRGEEIHDDFLERYYENQNRSEEEFQL